MKIALPIFSRWSEPAQRDLNGVIERAFEKLNDQAQVPSGGTSGQALVKASDRSLDLTWADAAGGGTTHAEPLTDGASNFSFAGGDIIVAVGVPN